MIKTHVKPVPAVTPATDGKRDSAVRFVTTIAMSQTVKTVILWIFKQKKSAGNSADLV